VVVGTVVRNYPGLLRDIGPGIELEDVVINQLEVVLELQPKVAAALNVILHVNKPVNFDVDREPVRSELGGKLLVDLDEHVVAAFDDRFLAFFLGHSVGEP
jgi:hypothetical protein